MKRVRHYLNSFKKSLFHKGEAFALEGGISFGPGRDPKGSFYNHPKLGIYWFVPDSTVLAEEPAPERGSLKGLLKRLGSIRKPA